MDHSAVRSLAERELEPLLDRMGLEWDVSLSYESEAADDAGHLKRGECTRLVDYDSAHIVLNPEAFHDEAGVLRTLRHELFHIILSPFDLFLSAVQHSGIEGPHADVLKRIWEHAVERGVINLERMWEANADA